ncbi:hypothetical protein AXF42_Ash015399 [Apostasia shenzhenica]|uniref:Uncharacterized protein n=1 Tax=Apostasia shenzhenica TaxID=1088818 RepID=A0A2H9ZS60_9ASPA|nr:hypothetical protein AXF42_Ash015399 [Apostasia shenzhenica]
MICRDYKLEEQWDRNRLKMDEKAQKRILKHDGSGCRRCSGTLKERPRDQEAKVVGRRWSRRSWRGRRS